MPGPLEFRASLIQAADEDALREQLVRERRTDGLPVILPTPERVEAMLQAAAFAGLGRDIVLGEVGPNLGEATIEKVAINVVMAGCLPEHLPVVIAAMQALCDPRLDTTEVQVTTHQIAPLLIVNGPAVKEAGLASGFGALGYGHRANLSIGRAVRLCLINLGGGWPGMSDMSLLGQPGMISYCLGEAEDDSPFPPLHTTLGFAADASAVTVTSVGSPHSVQAVLTGDVASDAERLLELLAHTIGGMGNNNAGTASGTIIACLNPDHARALHRAGLTRQDIQAELARRAGNPAGVLQRLRYGRTVEDPDRIAPAIGDPAQVLVVVAGGQGFYSAVMTPWGGGPHRNTYVTKEIVFYDACDLPVVGR